MIIDIAPNERAVIRVFAVNLPPEAIKRRLAREGEARLVAELLGRPLPEGGYELFPVTNLTGVGLTGYLREGYAVPPEALSGDRARLDALEGFVLLIFSQAFEGQATLLEAGAALTLIGTYGETQPDMRALPLESHAAQTFSGPGSTRAADPGNRRARSMMTGLVLLLMLGAVGLWLILGAAR
ncbi:MAG: hypothetical protein AAF744_07875 [Pseudomonadota bacterium]